MEFLKQIEDSIPTLKIRKSQLLTNENAGFVKWLKEQLSGNIRCSSAEEIQRIEYYLSQTLHNLYNIHKVGVFQLAIYIYILKYFHIF